MTVSYLIVTQPDLLFEMVHMTRENRWFPRKSGTIWAPHWNAWRRKCKPAAREGGDSEPWAESWVVWEYYPCDI